MKRGEDRRGEESKGEERRYLQYLRSSDHYNWGLSLCGSFAAILFLIRSYAPMDGRSTSGCGGSKKKIVSDLCVERTEEREEKERKEIEEIEEERRE